MNIEISSNSSNQEKHLIIVDLDGTILPDFTNVDKLAAEVLQKLNKKGHKVCIASGRNLPSILPVYHEIGLDTFIIAYNGALIYHPFERKTMATIAISNKVVKGVLSEKVVKDNLLNCMVDSVDCEIISTSDDIYYKEVFFNGNSYTKGDILKNLRDKDCLQLVLEFPNTTSLIDDIIRTLRKKYKNSITFYCGEKLKAKPGEGNILVPDHSKQIIKIRNYNANKGEAAKLVAGYYNISLINTVAFGNDINDIEMINKVGIGVAVSNSLNNLKAYVHDITEFDSHKGGVAKYLIDFFDLR
jgi:5-amino-6-(5-phospho-D-ribitylamino)uracil phosphatase